MCVIGKNQLVSLIKAHKCIHPFDYGLLDGDGYVLTVKEERTLHYLDSGFIGRLALELVNLSNERQPITIKRGDPLMHIEFMKREGEASPYSGGYMFQFMSEDEIGEYMSILARDFKTLFPKDYLTK